MNEIFAIHGHDQLRRAVKELVNMNFLFAPEQADECRAI